MKEFYLTDMDLLSCSGTSRGNQKKWYKDGLYIKEDHFGYESIAEALVSDMIDYIDYIPYVDYKLCLIHYKGNTTYGCYCEDMLADGESLSSVYRLLKYVKAYDKIVKYTGLDKVNFVVDSLLNVVKMQRSEILCYLGRLACIDAIVLNEDRHYNNIGFIVDSDGNWRCSPVFDNGLSLLSDTGIYRYDVDITNSIQYVYAKPFSDNFIEQIGYFNEILYFDAYDWFETLEYKYSEFKYDDFFRCKEVLWYQIRKLEGIAWKKR